MNDFYTWVNNELKRKGWNYAELARRSGLTRAAVTNTMNQKYNITWDFCNAIAIPLNTPPTTIFQKAGLLKIPPGQKETSELINIANNLTKQDLELLTDFAKLLYRRNK